MLALEVGFKGKMLRLLLAEKHASTLQELAQEKLAFAVHTLSTYATRIRCT